MGTGKYGLDTIRDKFANDHHSTVTLIFNVWKEKGKSLPSGKSENQDGYGKWPQ